MLAVEDMAARVIERWTPSQQRPDLVRARLEWRPPLATHPLVIEVPRFFERLSNLKRLAGL